MGIVKIKRKRSKVNGKLKVVVPSKSKNTQSNPKIVAKGDIFYTSWGYDQTNYDYVRVLKLSPSGKTATCQMVGFKGQEGGGPAYIRQKPGGASYGDTFKLRINKDKNWDDGNPTLRGSYPFTGGGKMSVAKRLDTFSKWDGKRSFDATHPMFGH